MLWFFIFVRLLYFYVLGWRFVFRWSVTGGGFSEMKITSTCMWCFFLTTGFRCVYIVEMMGNWYFCCTFKTRLFSWVFWSNKCSLVYLKHFSFLGYMGQKHWPRQNDKSRYNTSFSWLCYFFIGFEIIPPLFMHTCICTNNRRDNLEFFSENDTVRKKYVLWPLLLWGPVFLAHVFLETKQKLYPCVNMCVYICMCV